VSTTQNSGDFTLRGLRALVTGGGSGIGKAIADGMKSAGATVVKYDVNAICPGSVSGPRRDGVVARESAATGLPAEELRQGYANHVSLRTFVEASDIAASVVFLCSPAARFITGQVLPVDGNIETMRAD
jgi:NAD(P)-dependent dehydrogenase (short-subunit alcohol dehydrogenase family)